MSDGFTFVMYGMFALVCIMAIMAGTMATRVMVNNTNRQVVSIWIVYGVVISFWLAMP